METNNTVSAFITHDFTIEDFNFEAIDRYDLTSELKAKTYEPFNYGFRSRKKFNAWAIDHLSFEELYQVPMMNAVYYYPFFVSFEKENRYKVAPTTTLFYDSYKKAWAVGLTGGGMDLAPNLLDTFIRLEKGIPINIAESISRDYSAYIDRDKHRENCKILANAFNKRASILSGYADGLE